MLMITTPPTVYRLKAHASGPKAIKGPIIIQPANTSPTQSSTIYRAPKIPLRTKDAKTTTINTSGKGQSAPHTTASQAPPQSQENVCCSIKHCLALSLIRSTIDSEISRGPTSLRIARHRQQSSNGQRVACDGWF